MESGGLGGGGGVSGRDRGEGSDAPDFSGFGTGFGNPMDDFEREIDRVNRANELLDLASEREQERTGRLGVTAVSTLRDQEKEKSFLEKARDFAISKGISVVAGLVPGIGPVIDVTGRAIAGKAMGKTDQEIENEVGRSFANTVTGGMFDIAAIVGEGLGKAASALGAKGNPDVDFGKNPASPGLGTEPTGDDITAGQTSFAQTGTPYTFSDGSQLIMDPKAIQAQQPKVVGLRTMERPTADNRQQIEQLLRRARAGRIS
jgi:hypothetical protein